ncbi:hypothetical protein KSD_24680 [Ktedonobacter sp. SOSP1-85]|nr:hypothetical protein KSD_24680 [Ktedonobacter sp. SOSP1-85]
MARGYGCDGGLAELAHHHTHNPERSTAGAENCYEGKLTDSPSMNYKGNGTLILLFQAYNGLFTTTGR